MIVSGSVINKHHIDPVFSVRRARANAYQCLNLGPSLECSADPVRRSSYFPQYFAERKNSGIGWLVGGSFMSETFLAINVTV